MSRSIPIKQLPRASEGERRAENVRRIVYERALHLFDSKGFRATSMNDIAEACGVSKPAIYHYYRNKSHLLETLYEDVTAEFFMTMEKLARSPDDAATRLYRLIELQTLYNIENRRFLIIFWRERHEFDPASRKSLAAREREFEAWVQHVIEEGQAAGEFRRQDPKIAMMGILGLLSTVHRWAPHAGATPAAIADELGRLVLDGLAAVPDSAGRAAAQHEKTTSRAPSRRRRTTKNIAEDDHGGNQDVGS